MTLVLATTNQGKIREIVSGLALPALIYRSLMDYPQIPEIAEDGATFRENAFKKAQVVSTFVNLPVLADDSGLEVDALQGAPGIYSARFAGTGASDQANNEKLLSLLKEIPEEQRTARFVCVMVLYLPSGDWFQAEGICEGRIALKQAGGHGFGYDPVFYVSEFQKTMAELPLETKNRISHRARALTKIRPHLQSMSEKISR
jgi:XTP/dITP diphosphohydrolase